MYGYSEPKSKSRFSKNWDRAEVGRMDDDRSSLRLISLFRIPCCLSAWT